MTDIHDTADLVSKALRRAWQLGQTYWQQADSEYQSHWKKADATQNEFDRLEEDTRAAILTANSGAQPAPSVPREAIEKMLTQLMDIAVSNGANSISMPDEYVEVAAWLCGIPAQPAPSFADAYQGAMEEVAIWKKRALEAEDLNRKFIAEINGPTHMGEPVAQPAPSVQDVPAKSLKPVIDWLRNGCDPMKAADELEILIAAAPEAKP